MREEGGERRGVQREGKGRRREEWWGHTRGICGSGREGSASVVSLSFV